MRGRSDVEEVGRFGWIRDSAIDEAGCLTLVREADVDQVAAAFGAIAHGARPLDFEEFCEEAFAHYEQYPVIGVRQMGGWTLVVEDNGHEGSRAEVLRRASHGTEVVSALWNVNALTRFNYAVDGEVRTSFEALLPEYREGTRPDALEELRAGLPWRQEHLRRDVDTVSLMLALIARITGQEITSDWLKGEFATYPVAAWPKDLPVVAEAVSQVDTDFPAELLEATRWADAPTQRRAAAEVARHTLRRTGIDDHPLVREALLGLVSPERIDRVALDEVVRTWTWVSRAQRVTDTVRAQVRALEVLRQATNPDALLAVVATISAAVKVRGVEQDDVVALVAAELAKP